jgi:outer membrane cobalamin receptor
MLRFRPRLFAVLCLVPLFVVDALAEEKSARESTEEGSTLDERIDSNKVESLVIRGVRTGVLADDPSAFSTTIDLESLVGEQKQLADILSETPGVQIRRFGGPGDRAEISIRGFAPSQVVVVLDDVRINPARGGGVDLSSIPIELLEEVAITRGGGAVTAGSGAMGGVLQLRTRRPGAHATAGVSGSGGPHQTWKGSFFSAAPGEHVDYALGYTFFHTDGDFEFQRPSVVLEDGKKVPFSPRSATRLNNDQKKHTAIAKLGRPIGETSYLSLEEIFAYANGGEPGFDNGSGMSAGQQTDARLRQAFSLSRIAWEGIPMDSVGAEIEGSISYRFDRSEFKNPKPTFGDPLEDDANDTTAALALTSKWQPNLFELKNGFALEFGASRDVFDASDQDNRNRESVYAVARSDASFFNENLRIASALRIDWAEGFSRRWIPSLGATWLPLPWLQFKGNAERSFRVPSFKELFLPDRGFEEGNPDLNPEKANNFDIGLELLFDAVGPLEKLRFEAAYFYSDIQNSIVWVPVSRQKVRPRNTDAATAKGWELTSSLRVGRYCTLSANHTIVDANYDRVGKRLPGRAEHETNVRVGIQNLDLWKIVGELQRTGSISVNPGGGLIIPSRNVWNASAATNLAELARRWGFPLALERLWVSVALNNIGDQSVRDAHFVPQPGRTLSLALEGVW